MEYYIVIGIAVLIILYFFITFNILTKLENKVEEAFSTMDVYLKKRWDLIPNLVETVKGYAKHEKDTLTEIVAIRNERYDSLNTDAKLNVNNKMSGEIKKIMALVESYPDLKADKNYIELSKQLTIVEEDIANARKYYNATVRVMNNKVEMFPSNIIARITGFKTKKMFGIEERERKNVKVEL